MRDLPTRCRRQLRFCSVHRQFRALEIPADSRFGCRIVVADLSSSLIRTCKNFWRRPDNDRSSPVLSLSTQQLRHRYLLTSTETRCSNRESMSETCIKRCKPIWAVCILISSIASEDSGEFFFKRKERND